MNIRQANKFGTLAPDKLAAFEAKHSIRLPEDYRQFLLETNGGNPHPANAVDFVEAAVTPSSYVSFFYGIHDGENWARIESAIKDFKGRIINEGLPIAEDPGGNQYVLLVKGKNTGQVYFWEHDGEPYRPSYKNMNLVASSFTEFTEKLYEYIEPNEPQTKRILRENDVEGLKQLLNAGYDLESTDEHGRTLIENAAIHNRPELIRVLFDRGAQLHNAQQLARDNYKWWKEFKATVDLLEKLQTSKDS